MEAGYTGEGRGAHWVQKALGWTAQIVRHPSKPAPEEVMRRWVRAWANEGVAVDSEKFSGNLAYVRRSAAAMGCGADVLVALSEQEDEQRLRALGCHERNVRLRR
jgi:hypothetical protein